MLTPLELILGALATWAITVAVASRILGRGDRRPPPTPYRPAPGYPLTREQLDQVDAYDWPAAERDLTGRHAPPEQP